MTHAQTLPSDVTRLLTKALGDVRLLAVHGHTRHGDPYLWEVADEVGGRWFAKRHSKELSYLREVHAYQHATAALPPGRVAALHAHDADALLVVTGAVDGTALRHTPLTARQRPEAYRQAGKLLRKLHDQPLPDVASPGDERDVPWPQERERALNLAREVGLGIEDLALLDTAMAVPPPVLPLVVCHGDFSPRNWIVDTTSGDGMLVRLIDFERSQVEEAVRRDLMRIVYQITAHQPELREAFFDGYGRTLTDAEQAGCRAYAAIDCPSALRWATKHRDDEIQRYGLTMLNQLRRPAD
ncbi:aminoglycoside phosphotransferase family protein [Kitasatospora camelliae]|uniref:Aminoglycoside phosphotransferase family protein n=1 Tax=Kitasatospora camelliae TaxID=3156397 RepID=A0AAU8JVN0_9ACTN